MSTEPQEEISNTEIYQAGFKAGFKQCEAIIRQALGGHTTSELFGEHGLLEATMKCVRAIQDQESSLPKTTSSLNQIKQAIKLPKGKPLMEVFSQDHNNNHSI